MVIGPLVCSLLGSEAVTLCSTVLPRRSFLSTRSTLKSLLLMAGLPCRNC